MCGLFCVAVPASPCLRAISHGTPVNWLNFAFTGVGRSTALRATPKAGIRHDSANIGRRSQSVSTSTALDRDRDGYKLAGLPAPHVSDTGRSACLRCVFSPEDAGPQLRLSIGELSHIKARWWGRWGSQRVNLHLQIDSMPWTPSYSARRGLSVQ